MSLAALLAAAAVGGAGWSAPASLSRCTAVGAPRVVFPSDSPSHATGAGAIVWSAGAGCPGGGGARIAPVGTDDAPARSLPPRSSAGEALAPHGALLATGAPHGQLAIAGQDPRAPGDALVVQGAAGGPFSPLVPAGGAGAPVSLATAFLGDLALAAPLVPAARAPTSSRAVHANGGLGVHVERFFASGFERNASVGIAARGDVRTLALALDFRGETLAVWQQAGSLYARLLPNKGAPAAVQRLARVGSARVHATAVLSDDRHAIVAWAQQRGDRTAVYLDISRAGVRFGMPLALESVRDHGGVAAPSASPELVRLSTEGVVLAWDGSEAGRSVVRVAPVDLDGLRAPSTVAVPDGDAALSDLAAGPHGSALVLWTQPQTSVGVDPYPAHQALYSASALDTQLGGVTLGDARQIALVGARPEASAAFDPASGRAIAVWRGMGGSIGYSIGEAGGGA